MSAALARNGRLGIARDPPHSCSRETSGPFSQFLPAPRSRSSGLPMPFSGPALGAERSFEPARLVGPLLRDRLGRHDDQQLRLRARRGRRSAALPARNVPPASGAAEGRARDRARHEAARSELRTRRRPHALLGKAPEIDATGLDIAESAVRFCRDTYGESERRASSREAPSTCRSRTPASMSC